MNRDTDTLKFEDIPFSAILSDYIRTIIALDKSTDYQEGQQLESERFDLAAEINRRIKELNQ